MHMLLFGWRGIGGALENLIVMHYASTSECALFHLLALDKSEIDHAFHCRCPIVVWFLAGHSAHELVLIYGHHACLFSSFAVFLVLIAFWLTEDLIYNNVSRFFDKMLLLAWSKYR